MRFGLRPADRGQPRDGLGTGRQQAARKILLKICLSAASSRYAWPMCAAYCLFSGSQRQQNLYEAMKLIGGYSGWREITQNGQ